MALPTQSPFPVSLSIGAGESFRLVLNTLTYGTSDYADLVFQAHSNTPSIVTVVPEPDGDVLLISAASTIGTGTSAGRIVIAVEDVKEDEQRSYSLPVTVTQKLPPQVTPFQRRVTADEPLVGDDITGVDFILGQTETLAIASYISTPLTGIRTFNAQTLSGAVTGVVNVSAGTVALTAANAGSYVVRLNFTPTSGQAFIVDIHGTVTVSTDPISPRTLDRITMAAYANKQIDLNRYDWARVLDGYNDLGQLTFTNQQSDDSLTIVQVDHANIATDGTITLRSLGPGQTVLRWAVAEAATGAFLVQLRIALAMRDVMSREPPPGEWTPRDPSDPVANIPMTPPPLPVDAVPTTMPDAPAVVGDDRFVMVERVRAIVSNITIAGGIMTLECRNEDNLRGRRERQVAPQLGGPFSFVGIYERDGIAVEWPTEKVD